MAGLALGWIGEPALASLIQPSLDFIPERLATPTAHSIAVAMAFTIITSVEIIFGELTPKWIALEKSEATAIWVVKPLELFMRTLWRFIRLVHGAAQAVITAWGMKGADRCPMGRSEGERKTL